MREALRRERKVREEEGEEGKGKGAAWQAFSRLGQHTVEYEYMLNMR